MREYIDFLGSQAPYDALEAEDLQSLARLIEVEYFLAGAPIIIAGSSPLTHLYVVRSGEVEVTDRGRVIDVLGAGETFGQVSTLSGLPPALGVRASEDVLCYRFLDPRPYLNNPERLRFTNYGSRIGRDRLARSGLVDQALRLARHQMRPVVWCPAHASITDAAAAVTTAGQSCALIDRGDMVGIVTDSDFRSALSESPFAADGPVSGIATFPVESVEADALAADAFLRMVESGYHHLVVTDGGSRPIGILRVVDLVSAEMRNPLVIRRAIDSATTIDELAQAAALLSGTWVELHDTGVAVMHIAALMSAVLDALMLRVLDLTVIGDDAVMQDVSWMLMGSVARREPLPRSDIDTALVWKELDGAPDPSSRLRQWAGRVLDNMELCGLPRCSEGANANNPLFARSRSEAISIATSWITDPTQLNALLLSSMIADSRPLTGMELGRSVSDAMLATTRSRHYLWMLLRYALSARPPVGFVRGLVVEHTGNHRGHLNLKAGGLVPIASLGRWVAIATGNDRGSTVTRLRRGNAEGLLTDDETDSLIRAFEYIYELVLDNEVSALRSDDTANTWVAPKDLDTLTRRYLREAFRSVTEVQRRLHASWVVWS